MPSESRLAINSAYGLLLALIVPVLCYTISVMRASKWSSNVNNAVFSLLLDSLRIFASLIGVGVSCIFITNLIDFRSFNLQSITIIIVWTVMAIILFMLYHITDNIVWLIIFALEMLAGTVYQIYIRYTDIAIRDSIAGFTKYYLIFPNASVVCLLFAFIIILTAPIQQSDVDSRALLFACWLLIVYYFFSLHALICLVMDCNLDINTKKICFPLVLNMILVVLTISAISGWIFASSTIANIFVPIGVCLSMVVYGWIVYIVRNDREIVMQQII